MSGPAGHTVVNRSMLSQNLQVSGIGKLKQAPGRKSMQGLDWGPREGAPLIRKSTSELTPDGTEARAGSRTGCRQKNRLRKGS